MAVAPPLLALGMTAAPPPLDLEMAVAPPSLALGQAAPPFLAQAGSTSLSGAGDGTGSFPRLREQPLLPFFRFGAGSLDFSSLRAGSFSSFSWNTTTCPNSTKASSLFLEATEVLQSAIPLGLGCVGVPTNPMIRFKLQSCSGSISHVGSVTAQAGYRQELDPGTESCSLSTYVHVY
ncbi:UNVERIFIED_CONTAM: hypothetical protein FKN15_057315 [Acipenser sinensis]